MNLTEDLIANLTQDAPVRGVVVSTHSTVVCSLHCGLSATAASIKPHGEEFIRDAGQLHQKSARELAYYALSTNPLEASIGFAAINSLLVVDEKKALELNAAQIAVHYSKGKQVVIVGHFPFISQVKEVARECWVLEQNPADGEYAAEHASTCIPIADLLILTGSVLVNQTFLGIMHLMHIDTLVMMVGPSTPLSTLLFDHGVHIISGVRVTDEQEVVRSVSQGAIFRQMKGVKRLVLVRPELHAEVIKSLGINE